ncbi:hypothetical protein OSB04_007004 [Centaurea solstitialis]|uniref:Uncharacterized protein n=1 Tax=Centaurea solstitialis TaxID=347529 RepID=A0AA38WSC3_9ASTR|nr:hypothetical protein OSB04_007004 [Centaurea solstitialis]
MARGDHRAVRSFGLTSVYQILLLRFTRGRKSLQVQNQKASGSDDSGSAISTSMKADFGLSSRIFPRSINRYQSRSLYSSSFHLSFTLFFFFFEMANTANAFMRTGSQSKPPTLIREEYPQWKVRMVNFLEGIHPRICEFERFLQPKQPQRFQSI